MPTSPVLGTICATRGCSARARDLLARQPRALVPRAAASLAALGTGAWPASQQLLASASHGLLCADLWLQLPWRAWLKMLKAFWQRHGSAGHSSRMRLPIAGLLHAPKKRAAAAQTAVRGCHAAVSAVQSLRSRSLNTQVAAGRASAATRLQVSTTLLLGLELISDIGARAGRSGVPQLHAQELQPMHRRLQPQRRRLQPHAFEAATACT